MILRAGFSIFLFRPVFVTHIGVLGVFVSPFCGYFAGWLFFWLSGFCFCFPIAVRLVQGV